MHKTIAYTTFITLLSFADTMWPIWGLRTFLCRPGLAPLLLGTSHAIFFGASSCVSCLGLPTPQTPCGGNDTGCVVWH